jgi:hypothetical protein
MATHKQGRIQDFKLGGGGALKKIAPIGGRRENVGGISCEKSRFYAKKFIFFQILGGGGRAPPPPGSAPAHRDWSQSSNEMIEIPIYQDMTTV